MHENRAPAAGDRVRTTDGLLTGPVIAVRGRRIHVEYDPPEDYGWHDPDQLEPIIDTSSSRR
jgi:hypothetical protein